MSIMCAKVLCNAEANSVIDEGRGPMNLLYICAKSVSHEKESSVFRL